MYRLEELTLVGSYNIIQGLLKILKSSDSHESPIAFPNLTYLQVELKDGHGCSSGIGSVATDLSQYPIGSHCSCTITDCELADDLRNALFIEDEDDDTVASRALEVLKVSECLVDDSEEIEFIYGDEVLELLHCCCTHANRGLD